MAILLSVSPASTTYVLMAKLGAASSVTLGGALVATAVCVRSAPTWVGVAVGRGIRIVLPGPGRIAQSAMPLSRSMAVFTSGWTCPYW